jgi:hypothetical protein
VKRLLLITLFAVLALPAAAVADPRPGDEDGTLSVKDATGRIMIRATGGFIGRFDHGSIRIIDPLPDDGTGPIVSGAERAKDVSDTMSVYSGTKVRFRLIGGKFKILVFGSGIDISVVGRGTVTLDGPRGAGDGRYSFNGDAYSAMPDVPTTFDLVTGFTTGL